MNMTSWKILGTFDKSDRPSGVTLVIAILIASETFINPQGNYPVYMSILALVSCAYLTYRGLKAKAILSLAFPLIAAVWLNPLFGGTWFDEIGVEFFAAHSLLALLTAIAGYSFMRFAPRSKKSDNS